MEHHANELVDARQVAVTMREIIMDLTRAFLAAVPSVLLDEKLAPEQIVRLTQRICRETRRRFTVGAAATLVTLD